MTLYHQTSSQAEMSLFFKISTALVLEPPAYTNSRACIHTQSPEEFQCAVQIEAFCLR